MITALSITLWHGSFWCLCSWRSWQKLLWKWFISILSAQTTWQSFWLWCVRFQRCREWPLTWFQLGFRCWAVSSSLRADYPWSRPPLHVVDHVRDRGIWESMNQIYHSWGNLIEWSPGWILFCLALYYKPGHLQNFGPHSAAADYPSRLT